MAECLRAEWEVLVHVHLLHFAWFRRIQSREGVKTKQEVMIAIMALLLLEKRAENSEREPEIGKW